MRILYLLTSLGIGGAEKQVILLAERMASKGHTVSLIVLKHSEEEWPVKFPVLRLNIRKTPMGILRGLRFAKSFVSLFRPDILHSHTFPANIFARMLSAMLRRTSGSPRVINTIHNVIEGGWHRMAIYRVTDPFANQITAVSSAAADRFVRLHAVPARKMRVLTNGIDAEFFTSDRARRRRMRAEMRAGVDFIWLAVGRLVPAKDYPNLLRAFADVRLANPKAQLWIAGEGEVSSLSSGLPEPQENASVQFLGLRRDIVDLLDAADGFVLSSEWEGLPLALAEAMSMEKVVVATDVGGVRELIADAGFIVPAKDSRALTAAMLETMDLGEMKRKFFGRNARERVQQHFSMDAKAIEWEQLYHRLIDGKTV